MELLFEDGSNLPLSPTSSPTELGRRSLPNSGDRTISRRHILLRPHGAGADVGVDFEVVGRNPIWVAFAGDGHGGRIFRKFEKGKLASGDRFCLSVRNPCFVLVCGAEVGERRKMETLEREAAEIGEVGAVQVPGIDPVKEFGFLVIGHEFDNYPKSKIRDVRNWDWFLDGSKQDSEDEVTVEERPSTREKVMKRKGKKKDRDSDDEDWTGESEGEEEKIARLRSSKRPRAAATRSKDEVSADELRKQKLDALGRNEEEDDDDETLGGFIVDNAGVEEEEGVLSNDEEEFTDEDEDDDE